MTEINQPVSVVEGSLPEVPSTAVEQVPGNSKSKNKLYIAIVVATLFVVVALIFWGVSMNSVKKGDDLLPSPSVSFTVTPTADIPVAPSTTPLDTVTPSTTPTVTTTSEPTVTSTPTPTFVWNNIDGNFLKIMAGDTTATNIPVTFEVPTGFVVEGTLIGDSCVQQKISNGNPSQGIVGSIIVAFRQTCAAVSTANKLVTGWKDIGTITHLADDGSKIHVVRIPGSTKYQYEYVNVLKPVGESVVSSDLYDGGLILFSNNNIGDAMGVNAVGVQSVK